MAVDDGQWERHGMLKKRTLRTLFPIACVTFIAAQFLQPAESEAGGIDARCPDRRIEVRTGSFSPDRIASADKMNRRVLVDVRSYYKAPDAVRRFELARACRETVATTSSSRDDLRSVVCGAIFDLRRTGNWRKSDFSDLLKFYSREIKKQRNSQSEKFIKVIYSCR